MTGFLALIHVDGGQVDAALFESLADQLRQRGCATINAWTDGSASFALGWPSHVLKDAGSSIDSLNVVGDVRLDARQDLVVKLNLQDAPSSDFRLLATAYRKWHHETPLHLLGDFSFAIYDTHRRELFCARDHFAFKPLFYARTRSGLLVSNSLEPILAHPEIRHELDDLAIADYLLFDHQQDPTVTAYKDVRRLPAAHSLTFGPNGLTIERYWTLPVEHEASFRNANDYPEAFTELLKTAIRDRVQDVRCSAVLMSGGLDSTSVAALAREIPHDIAAFTLLSNANRPDPEAHFSKLAADHIGIPITQYSLDNYTPLEGWNALPHHPPEPIPELYPRGNRDYMQRVLDYSPVALSGYGGDPGLYASALHARKTLKSANALPYLAAAARYALAYRKLPNIGLRTSIRGKPPWDSGELPKWLNPELVHKLDLRGRWRAINSPGPLVDTLRPEAYRTLTMSTWEQLFWVQDPGFTGLPVEVRHPMFDLRVLTFLLRVPPMPWCVDKELLRVAMKGRLPESVRLRPKTPAGTVLPVSGGMNLPPTSVHPLLSRFVTALPTGYLDSHRYESWVLVRPYLLNLWLHGANMRGNR